MTQRTLRGLIILDCISNSKRMLSFVIVLLCWTLSIAEKNCPPGFYAERQNETCTDVNECITGGHSQCGQLCTNTMGSYHCSCLPGYMLEADKWSCYTQAPDLYIMFSHGHDISKMDQGGVHVNPVLERAGDIASFDYHYNSRLLYWIDGHDKSIRWAPLDGGESGVLVSNLRRPRQLSVDWISNSIFWTDAKTKQIERVNLIGADRDVVIQTANRKPNCIAVDPFQGYIFWSTSGGKKERLERSNLDGSNHRILMTATRQDIVSITLDIIDRRLFWLDNGSNRIVSIGYDGMNTEIVKSGLSNNLYGLSLFTDHVYWTELTSQTLNQANKYTGEDLVMIQTTYLDTHPKSITVVHPLRQPPTDPTDAVNCRTDGDCPLVIPVNQPAEAKPFLVITNRQDIQRINFDGTDYAMVAVGEMENLVAVDYDVLDEMIYFADQGRREIGRVRVDTSEREVLVGPADIDVVEGIAIDWMHRRLYWTDSGSQTISTCSVDGGGIKVILHSDLQHPKAIAVHPALNLVYWSDIAQPAKIEAVRHDGTHRVTVATVNVTEPNSLAIDYLNNKLIWLDVSRRAIEMSNLDGTFRSVVTDHLSGLPYAVTEFEDYVWYTEWQENKLAQIDKRTGEKRVRLLGSFSNSSGIQVVHPTSKQIGRINPCMVFNGGCEQICLVAHVNQVICSCDAGYRLKPDGVSCSMDECYTGQAQCHPHAICLDKEEGYDCRCEPGYLGDGYYCFRPTTPRSQLIAAPAVTYEPFPATSPPSFKAEEPSPWSANPDSATSATSSEVHSEFVTTMSKKTLIGSRGAIGSLTPRRSTTLAPGQTPRISTTAPPGTHGRGRINGKGSASGANGANKDGISIGGTNNGGSRGTNNTNGGRGGKTSGNNNNTGNNNNKNGFDTSGLGNLFPGVTKGYRPTDSHFGVCPSEYKYYCLNGGKCSWSFKLAKPSCRCLYGYAGERCLWVEPSYKSGISGITMAAIGGGILLPLIIFVLIVAFVFYRKKRNGKLEKIRRASRPEITLQTIHDFNQSPSSKNNSHSGSSFCSSSRRSSICTALISAPVLEDEEALTEPHATASQTRSDPTAPGSPSLMKAVMSRLSDPIVSSSLPHHKLSGVNHYQVPKKNNPAVMPKPQFMLAGGVATLARRLSQDENLEKDDGDEHTYSYANHYVAMNTEPTTTTSTMPRLSQTHKYMAMDYNYPSTSLGRKKTDKLVLYANTPKTTSPGGSVIHL